MGRKPFSRLLTSTSDNAHERGVLEVSCMCRSLVPHDLSSHTLTQVRPNIATSKVVVSMEDARSGSHEAAFLCPRGETLHTHRVLVRTLESYSTPTACTVPCAALETLFLSSTRILVLVMTPFSLHPTNIEISYPTFSHIT